MSTTSNDPEIFLEVLNELGDPRQGYPHDHTIRIPGCMRCDLAAAEAEEQQKADPVEISKRRHPSQRGKRR